MVVKQLLALHARWTKKRTVVFYGILVPGPEVGQATGRVECRERLGGLLRYYYRAAA